MVDPEKVHKITYILSELKPNSIWFYTNNYKSFEKAVKITNDLISKYEKMPEIIWRGMRIWNEFDI